MTVSIEPDPKKFPLGQGVAGHRGRIGQWRSVAVVQCCALAMELVLVELVELMCWCVGVC